jgi:hypothetical protein
MKWRALKPALIALVMLVYMLLDHTMRDLPPLHALGAQALSPEFDTKTPILPFKRCRLDITQHLTCAIGEVL